MLVTLTPGVDRTRILDLLNQAKNEAGNHAGQPEKYVGWALGIARMLRGQISSSDLDQLVFTPTFYRLLDRQGAGTMQGQLLLEAEIHERTKLFGDAAEALAKQIRTLDAAASAVLAVVDTSVFLSHPQWTAGPVPEQVIESIPWATEMQLGFEDVQLILPEVVIKELDRLKESGNQTLRGRASVTLAVVDRLLPHPDGVVLIRATDSDRDAIAARGEMPHGEVRLRVFYDDPSHRPLADADAEVIARALAVQALAGKDVQLLTMDTGMALKARRAGLRVHKPTRPPHPANAAAGARA